MRAPTVTLAVPLYRSARFVDDIAANLDAVELDDVEIIVSDRHGHDDALPRLRRRLRSDDRVRFVERFDTVHWVDHYNDLAAAANGRYLRWMPHDDLFPECDLARLVDRLERQPRAVLAYGPTRAIALDGRPLPEHDTVRPSPDIDGTAWTLRHSVDLFRDGHASGAFKGLFRRDLMTDRGLRIRPVRGLAHSERAWLFGVSLAGALVWVDDYHYVKRFHPESTHARWQPSTTNSLSLGATMLGYLWSVGGASSFLRGAPGIVGETVRRTRSIRGDSRTSRA